MGEPRLIPIQDAAQQTGLARSTIYRYIRMGFLKKYRAAGFDRRTYVEIDALMELKKNPPFREVP
jgi:predicted DNA-binding transcriptional regulator AlpA